MSVRVAASWNTMPYCLHALNARCALLLRQVLHRASGAQRTRAPACLRAGHPGAPGAPGRARRAHSAARSSGAEGAAEHSVAPAAHRAHAPTGPRILGRPARPGRRQPDSPTAHSAHDPIQSVSHHAIVLLPGLPAHASGQSPSGYWTTGAYGIAHAAALRPDGNRATVARRTATGDRWRPVRCQAAGRQAGTEQGSEGGPTIMCSACNLQRFAKRIHKSFEPS